MTQISGVKFSSNMSDFARLYSSPSPYFVVPEDYKVEELEREKIKIKESREIKKKHRTIKIIGGIVGGIFLLFGGIRMMPKSAIKRFEKLKEHVIRKADDVTTSSRVVKFYKKILVRMRDFAEKARGFNNFVSFKDIWFQRKITDKVPILKKICDGITRMFDNTGQKVVRNSYRSSLKKFDKLNNLYTNVESELLKDGDRIVTIKGVQKSVSEWVKDLAEYRKQLSQILEDNFTENHIIARNRTLKEMMSDLGDKVWAESFGKKGSFRRKDTYLTFWADKFLAKDKVKFVDEVNKNRIKLKFGRHDKARVCNDILESCKKFINPQDVASEKVMREIDKLLKKYNYAIDKTPDILSDLRTDIIRKTEEFDTILFHGKDTFKYDDNILNAIKTHTEQIKNIFTLDERGCIDEMNEIYRALLDEKEFKHIKQTSKNAVFSLDNSIRKETNDYFDKLRDWTLGAAPTDILGVLFGFGSMGTALALTNDKEKRKSILLKAGIPAVGGAAVMMAMTARLTSGAKGLLAGLASSLVLNKIGAFVDKKFSEQNHSQTS